MNSLAQEVQLDQKQIESTKFETTSKWVIDFGYKDQKFKVKSDGHRIEIVNDCGMKAGEITGHYITDEKTSEVIFQVSEVGNASVHGAEEGTPTFMLGHIQYLIAESITQIILSGKIDKWLSSEGTNSGSDKMYMHIKKEGRVEVQTIQSVETFQYHYEITCKKTKSTTDQTSNL